VIDLGCGTGDDSRAIGRLVGANGQMVAIDFSATMIAEAQRSCIRLWKPPNIKPSCATAKQIVGRMEAKPFAHEADELTLVPQH
jgi:trans-aconitate methyltransferase